MAELGALSLRIEENGGAAVLQKLQQIDSAAKLTDVSLTTAVAALNKLGIAATATGNSITVASADLARAADLVKRMGSNATVSAGEIDKMGAAVRRASLAAPRPFLGPALPTTTTASAAQASSVAALRAEEAAQLAVARARQVAAQAHATEKVASLAGIAAIERRIRTLTAGAQLDATRADSVRRLIVLETTLERALQRGNVTTEQRVLLTGALSRTQAGIASGIQQVTHATNRGAAVAATAVQQFQVLGRDVVQTSGKLTGFGKSGLNAFNAIAFGASQMAATGQASFRSLAASSASMLAFFGPQGAIAAGVIATGLVFADFFSRTKKGAQETADALNKLVLAGNQRFVKDQPVTAARIEEARAQANVDRLNREIAAKQAQIQKPGAGLAAAALVGERKALEAELKTASFALVEAQRQVADALKTTGDAAGEAADKEVAALAQVLAAGKATNAERQQAAIYLAKARSALELLTQSNRVDKEAVVQRAALLERIKTLTDAQAEAAKRATQADEARQKVIADEIAALSTIAKARQLSGTEVVRLAALERQLTEELRNSHPSKLREAEIWEQITRARQAAATALPAATVQPLTPGTPQPIRPGDMRVPEGLTPDLGNFEAFRNQVNKSAQQNFNRQAFADTETALAESLGAAISNGIAAGFAFGLADGGIGEGIRQMTAQTLANLGSLGIETAIAAIKIGQKQQTIAAAIASWNPFAVIAAATALLLLSRALGGRGRGDARSGGAGGSFGAGSGDDTLRSFVLGPNASTPLHLIPKELRSTIDQLRNSTGTSSTSALSSRIASSASMLPVSAAPHPLAGVQLMVVNDPAGTSYLARRVNDFNRDRGGR